MRHTLNSQKPSQSLYLATVVMLILFLGSTARATLPNYRLCFPDVINTPDTFLIPPNPDGVVVGDNGWTSSFRYVIGNGTPNSDVVVQGIKDGSFLYLSFEVKNDPTFDLQDMIIIAFDPDGTAANRRRLHIFPVFTTGAGIGGDPFSVEYWKNTATWNGASQALPAGTVIKVTSAGAGPVAWNVEMKLPTAAAGFGLPAGPFGFYFNVMRFNTAMGTVVEKHWPPSPDSPDISLFPNNTPDVATWGNGALSGACNGVSINTSDITTNQVPTSKISTTTGNIFNVLVHNNSINSAGAAIPANQVNATFRIANFGIPGPWGLVPAPGNPTTFTTNIPMSGTNTISTGIWNLTPGQVAQYSTPATEHQCILVELDSTDPTTTFVNKSAWRNMDFAPASVFERTAEISAKGYKLPPGASQQRFDLFVTMQEDKLRGNPDSPNAVTTTGPISQLTWVAHGFRRTGNFIISRRRSFEIVDHAGSYGFFIQHAGDVGGWAAELKGGGLKSAGKNMYRLTIPQDGVATVATHVETREPGQPPKPKKCGQAGNFTGGAIILLAGVFSLGLAGYLPRRRRKS